MIIRSTSAIMPRLALKRFFTQFPTKSNAPEDKVDALLESVEIEQNSSKLIVLIADGQCHGGRSHTMVET